VTIQDQEQRLDGGVAISIDTKSSSDYLSRVDGRPYSEIRFDNIIIRKFSKLESLEELKWHRDSSNRRVCVVSGEGWMFQYDDSIPFLIKPGASFLIMANSWHRLIMGDTDLVLRIEEV
jgi:mannose-6-phosphate isomerase-like protein (cupin superfamily)